MRRYESVCAVGSAAPFWVFVRRALELVMHPARHQDEVTVNIDWSRIDAAQMITMTAAFINEMGAPGATLPTSAATQDESAAQPHA